MSKQATFSIAVENFFLPNIVVKYFFYNSDGTGIHPFRTVLSVKISRVSPINILFEVVWLVC